MIQQNQEVAQLRGIATQLRNLDDKTCNTQRNFNATNGLKALAVKALQCNTIRNFDATHAEKQRNFEAIKTPEKLRELHSIMPVKYGISLTELKTFLAEDWELYQNNTEALHCWADLLHERQLMEQGKIPKDFTVVTYCVCCGDVFIPPAQANNGSVDGCPWCWNKARGLPIPNAEPMGGETLPKQSK